MAAPPTYILEQVIPVFNIVGDGNQKTLIIDLNQWPFSIPFNAVGIDRAKAWMRTPSMGDALVGDFTTSVADNRILLPAHGLAIDDEVRFAGGSLPTPLVENTFYFVVALRGNDFQIGLTQGGAIIILTTTGSGNVWKKIETEVAEEELGCEVVDNGVVKLTLENPIPWNMQRTIKIAVELDIASEA